MRARVLGALLVLAPCGAAGAGDGFDAGRVGFAVRIGSLRIDYRVFTLSVLPGERLELESGVAFELVASGGATRRTQQGFVWTAPERVGWHTLELRVESEVMELQAVVMRAATPGHDGRLRGYRIGRYMQQPFRGLEVYRAPSAFVEVTPDLLERPVSPHFVLGQFLCKQESGWPKYLLLRPELLLALERILERLDQEGLRIETLEVMSAFRTPWYNQAIGNRTRSSRHLYGDAADVFVDVAPRDGVMDDLNGDGQTDKADADFLYDLLESFFSEDGWEALEGGLGSYGPTEAHGPFVHVDARGYAARWGREPAPGATERPRP